ncbi:hypothetical protein P9265_19555 [Schinkia azotoformans]|uniref:hypothetical protein n=1 Tax=Schinkia azotoformans TaxID=1454 RepID=UPI002E21ED91|nr:hypothetical protein [Schinkia azotoformans]
MDNEKDDELMKLLKEQKDREKERDVSADEATDKYIRSTKKLIENIKEYLTPYIDEGMYTVNESKFGNKLTELNIEDSIGNNVVFRPRYSYLPSANNIGMVDVTSFKNGNNQGTIEFHLYPNEDFYRINSDKPLDKGVKIDKPEIFIAHKT